MYVLYTAELFHVVARHQLRLHVYADDSLRLNPSKIEVMWLGTSQQLDKITFRNVPLLSTVVTVVDSARNLAVLSLTVSCHWTHLLLLSASAATTSYDNFVQ